MLFSKCFSCATSNSSYSVYITPNARWPCQRTLKKLANGTRASHTYDAADNLDKLYNFKSDNSVISSFDYNNNAVNNRTSVIESSGDRVTWSYDNTSQLLSEHRSGANAYSQTYTYDAAGNRLTNKVDNVISTYIYDESNQLIVCETSTGSKTQGQRTLNLYG